MARPVRELARIHLADRRCYTPLLLNSSQIGSESYDFFLAATGLRSASAALLLRSRSRSHFVWMLT